MANIMRVSMGLTAQDYNSGTPPPSIRRLGFRAKCREGPSRSHYYSKNGILRPQISARDITRIWNLPSEIPQQLSGAYRWERFLLTFRRQFHPNISYSPAKLWKYVPKKAQGRFDFNHNLKIKLFHRYVAFINRSDQLWFLCECSSK